MILFTQQPKNTLLALLALFVVSLNANAELNDTTAKWTVGVGVIASDNRFNDPSEDAFFPTLSAGNSDIFAVPVLSWQYANWTLSTNGATYKLPHSENQRSQFTLGFPFSGYQFSGNQGWFRYSAQAGIKISDGINGNYKFNLTGLDIELTHPLDERSGQMQWNTSFGAPIYLNKERGITLIATAGYRIENAEWSNDKYQFGLQQAVDDWLYHAQLSLVGIVKVNEHTRLLLTATNQWYDDALMQRTELTNPYSVNVFSMLTYTF